MTGPEVAVIFLVWCVISWLNGYLNGYRAGKDDKK
jgi:hypothetical protein